MVDEMLKLRKLLTKYGIEWYDASTPPDYPVWMDRTHFSYKGANWSVINGVGSIGGYDVFDNENKGLLELVSEVFHNGEPFGYLTADTIIKLVFVARELKLITSSNNARKMRHEPMFRRFTPSRRRRIKRTQPKQGKLRNKRHKYT